MWKKVSEYFILVCTSCFHPSFPRPLFWRPSPAHLGWKGERIGCWCCILASIPRVSHKRQQGLRVFWRHHQQGNLPNQPQSLPHLTYSTGDVAILKCHSPRCNIYCDKVKDLEKKERSPFIKHWSNFECDNMSVHIVLHIVCPSPCLHSHFLVSEKKTLFLPVPIRWQPSVSHHAKTFVA